jgi:hypothetical protein
LTFGIFEEIERLIEHIPIDTQTQIEDKFAKGVSIDSHLSFRDVDGVAMRLGVIEPGSNSVSFREIVKLFNKFLKDATIEEFVAAQEKYVKQVVKSTRRAGEDYRYYQKIQLPSKNILFDFCLAALEGDTFDAKLYLAHSFYFLGLRRRLILLLSVIVNESQLRLDKDIRKLLTLIAMIAEPDNIDVYFDATSGGFNNRYTLYLKEMQMLNSASVYNNNNNSVRES